MIQAVLFDWGDTLLQYRGIDADFALERTRVGLAALEREGLPEAVAVSQWFEAQAGERFEPESEDEVEWLAILAGCFSDLGCDLTDDDVRLYATASLWENELDVDPDVHGVLDELRDRSLGLAIVSNTVLPLWLAEPVFERQGLARRVDAIVLSSEVGKRKPHPAIFERALRDLDVDAERTLFVGDRRYQDVLGAKRLGMRTLQALWFRVDENPDGAEPDFSARRIEDVVAIVDGLRKSS
jgi:HAD superfamily hydrolase (TIGR01509 family)